MHATTTSEQGRVHLQVSERGFSPSFHSFIHSLDNPRFTSDITVLSRLNRSLKQNVFITVKHSFPDRWKTYNLRRRDDVLLFGDPHLFFVFFLIPFATVALRVFLLLAANLVVEFARYFFVSSLIRTKQSTHRALLSCSTKHA